MLHLIGFSLSLCLFCTVWVIIISIFVFLFFQLNIWPITVKSSLYVIDVVIRVVALATGLGIAIKISFKGSKIITQLAMCAVWRVCTVFLNVHFVWLNGRCLLVIWFCHANLYGLYVAFENTNERTNEKDQTWRKSWKWQCNNPM